MTTFDTRALAARLKTRRGSRPLRAVAPEIPGVSLSTLSRIENGSAPDMTTFLACCDWLAASPQEFFPDATPVSADADMDPITRIELALRADPALRADFIDALIALIRLFHAQPKSPRG